MRADGALSSVRVERPFETAGPLSHGEDVWRRPGARVGVLRDRGLAVDVERLERVERDQDAASVRIDLAGRVPPRRAVQDRRLVQVGERRVVVGRRFLGRVGRVELAGMLLHELAVAHLDGAAVADGGRAERAAREDLLLVHLVSQPHRVAHSNACTAHALHVLARRRAGHHRHADAPRRARRRCRHQLDGPLQELDGRQSECLRGEAAPLGLSMGA